MQIREDNHQDVLILAPVGHLDTRSQHEFEVKVLEKLTAGERRFLIDMAEVEYISSAGLRVMLMLAKKLGGTEGQLVLAGMNPHVHQVFEISGLTGVFTIRKDREEALGAFSSVDPTIAKVANLASRLMDVSRGEGAAMNGAARSPISKEDAAEVAEIAVKLLRLREDTGLPSRERTTPSGTYTVPRAANGSATAAASAPTQAPIAPAPVAPQPAAPAPAASAPVNEPVQAAPPHPAEAAASPTFVERLSAFFRRFFRG